MNRKKIIRKSFEIDIYIYIYQLDFCFKVAVCTHRYFLSLKVSIKSTFEHCFKNEGIQINNVLLT